MKFDWNSEKNLWLIEERGVSFEEAVEAIAAGKIFSDEAHPNQEKYPGQRIMVIELHDYCYLLPYVEDSGKIFLKTMIPSRKMTKLFLGDKR
ncbi:BrnT family toxin [Nitratifractor sp.]|uniref:BrnT family toxin n=1 Tax=Nitratifractor sp. TaxID=2268144 RepID=UPI0025EC7845|nr:BrnT family toxin [Nitratifractor sp.]